MIFYCSQCIRMDTVAWLWLFVVILSWTATPFLRKMATKILSVEEFMLISTAFVTLLLILYFTWLLSSRNQRLVLSKIGKMSRKYWCIVIVSSFVTFISMYAIVYLMKNEAVSHIIPHATSIVVLLTTVVAKVYFGEEISTLKGVGICLVISGVVCMNLKKMSA